MKLSAVTLRHDVQCVHVVTHRGRVFGVRTAGSETHLLAFRDRGIATAVAATLQTYVSRHGDLPVFEDSEGVRRALLEMPAAGKLTSVRVEETRVQELASKLAGRHLSLSVLYPLKTPGEFKWFDVPINNTTAATRRALQHAYEMTTERPDKPSLPATHDVSKVTEFLAHFFCALSGWPWP